MEIYCTSNKVKAFMKVELGTLYTYARQDVIGSVDQRDKDKEGRLVCKARERKLNR